MASILAKRWVHNTLLALMMAVVILVPPEVLPRPGVLAAIFILLAWVLGEHYERLTVLEAGFADRAELKEVERSKRGFLKINR